MEKDLLTSNQTLSMDDALVHAETLTPDDDPRLDPILPSQMTQAQKTPNKHTITMDQALKMYRADMESYETLNKIAKGDITTHFWGNFAKGMGDFVEQTKLEPVKLNGAIYRAFNGHIWPDMTEDEAVRLMDSTTAYVANQKNLLSIIQQSQGRADSVGSNLGAGALQVLSLGIVGLMTGGVGIGAIAGIQEFSEASQEMAEKAMEENGGTLRGYDNRSDAIYSALHGVISGYIETQLGVENLFTNSVKKQGIVNLGSQMLKSAAGEGAEEYLQESSKYLFMNMAGKENRTFGEFQKDALTNAVYGAILGGSFGTVMYPVNKLRIQKALKAQGFNDIQAEAITNDMIDTAKKGILQEVDTRSQLRDHYGEQWNNLQTKIVTALENAGWKETHPEIDLQKYAADNADDIVRPLFNMSNKFGIDTRDLLQLSDINVIDNAIYLKPMNLGSPEVIANRIREKREQVKRLTVLARTGAGNPQAKQDLNNQIELLQKVYEQQTGNRLEATRRTRAAKARQDAEILANTAPSVSETIASIDVSQMTTGQPTTQIRQQMDGQPFVYVGDKQLPVEYKVVPMDEVIASHIGQEINTKYSIKELQNRAQRGSRTDVSILQSRAAKIQPENLGIAYNTQNGAPVVNEKGEVIAGNGRYEVLRMTDEKGRARYNKYLESLGLDLNGIKDPILVRVLHNLTPEQQIAVADASNVSATSAFDNASQAVQDAKLLKGTTDVTGFLNKIPIESRQGLFLANDRVNKVVLDRRYNDAMMAWLLNNDTALYEELYLMGGITQKIQTALNQVIPGLMSLENQYPSVGLRADLAAALKRLPQIARSQDFAFSISQAEIDDARPNLFNENALLYALTFGKNTKTWEGTGDDRLQVGMTLTEFFDTYTQTATLNQEQQGQIDIFGQPLAAARTSGDILAETLTKAFPREFEDGTAISRDMKAVFLTRAQTIPGPTQFSQIDLLDTVQPSLFPDDTSTASAVRNLPWETPVNVSNPTFFNRMPDANDIEIARNNGIDSFLILDKNEVPSKLVLLDGSIIGLKPGAKIPSGKDLYKPSTPRQLFQTEERNLVVTHGISLRNLQKVLDLGGMAAPSIAISSINEPLTDFGTITLVGNKDIIDPAKSANRVYDRDIWSPTMPFKTYPKAKTKAANAFRDKFKSTFVKAGDEPNLGEVLYYTQNSARPEQAVQKFEWSRGAKLYYVENVLGKKIDIPTRSVNKDDIWGLHPDQEFIDALKDVYSMAPMDEVIKKVTDAARALINRTDYGKYTNKYRETFLQDYPADYSGNFNRMDSILYQTKKYAQNIGKTEVDTSALDRILDEYANNDQNYQKWAESQIEEMLGSPKVEVGKKLLDWNLENVTKAMLKSGTVNGQHSLVYGVGKVISAGSTRFTSIKGIKEAAKNLKTKKDAAELTDALGAKMQDFTNKFMSDSDFTNSMEQKEAAFRALGTLAASGNPTKERLQSVLNYEFGNKETYPDELLQEGVDIAKATKEVVRYYFEAKPQRSVLLTEFSGAVMPNDSSYDEMAKKLKDLGLQVERTDNLQQGIRNIENSVGGVLFQGRKVNGFYDPELEVIVLGRSSNTGTLPHEMSHYWANTIFNLVKSGKYNNNPDFMAQAMGMFRMLGVGMNQDTLTRDQQEQFATMTESVIFGMAPIPQGTELPMTAFLNWVPEKYKSILDIGYRDSTGRIVNPILDKQAVDWFNAWYANGTLPAIEMSPLEAQNTNDEQDNRIIPSSSEVMKVRATEMKTEADDLKRARTEQTKEAEEAMPTSERAAANGASVVIESQPSNIELSTPPAEKKKSIISHLIPGRGTNTREGMFVAARDYIAENREHAEEVAFGHPNEIMNDTGVDRAILIRALMEEYDRSDPKYGELYHNLAETVSLAGKTPGLSNDMNFQFYLSAVKQITDGMEAVAAIKYAGTRNLDKARRTFNSDIDAFIQENANKILSASAENKEILVKKMFAEAAVKFKGDESMFLNQEELHRVRGIKSKEAFIDWANREIRKMLKATPDSAMINKIMEESEKAQKAVKYLDSEDYGELAGGGKAIREWQMAVKEEQVPETWYSKLIGSWYPKAMLYNINTHTVNIGGNLINYGIVKSAVAAQYKEGNKVPESALKKERERLRFLYNSSLISVAGMRNPTSPTLLHGEQYNPREGKSTIGKIVDFSMDLLGKEDNWFRTMAYVDALGYIATADAKKTGQSPTDLFREYKKLNQIKGTRAYEARQEALNIADIAVFQQNGTLARNLKKVRDALNMGQTTGLGTLLGPFVKTPANIVEIGARAIAAPVTSTYHAVKGDWSIQDTISTGYFALACILLMGMMADYEPPYETPKPYDPNKPYDSVRIRGTNMWIKLDTFAAASIPMRIIASIATGKGLGVSGSMNEVPLLGDIADTWQQTAGIEKDPYKQGVRFAANVAYNRVNTAVPAVLKYTLAAMHPADLDLEQIETGLPKTGIGRKIGRQYGLAGGDTTTNDILRIFFNRLKIAAE